MVSLGIADTPVKVPVKAEQIYAPVEAELVLVQKSLMEIVPPDSQMLSASVAYSMQAQGKFLRPLLTLLASGASGVIEKPHIETAAVAELIHVATLLHDDVLDDADLRRGRATVRSRWGNKVAILSGDYLLAQASLKLSHLNQCRLVSIFATVLSNLCDGEVEQIRTSYNIQTSWESYFKKTLCKTASLFGACCESAGVINRLPEDQIQSLRAFGEYFGIAFQIIDDLLDYTSSEKQLGKPVLDDLKNGILNAPVLLALESYPADSDEYNQLCQVLENLFRQQVDQMAVDALREKLFTLFDQVKAIEKTQELAEEYIEKACQSLMFLKDSPYRRALMGLTRYATHREH